MLSCYSRVQPFVILWTVACQAPLSVRFSRQEYWSGLPFPSPGDLLDPAIEPVSWVFCIGRWILYHWATWETWSKGICFNSMWSRNECSCLFKIPSPPQLFLLITWSLFWHWAILLFYLSGHGDWSRDGLMTPVRAIRILRQTFSNWTGLLFFSFGHWIF